MPEDYWICKLQYFINKFRVTLPLKLKILVYNKADPETFCVGSKGTAAEVGKTTWSGIIHLRGWLGLWFLEEPGDLRFLCFDALE